ncbi:MAG: hypothetical protein Q9162_003359 [Coniocarpon cinnabarinum]
MAHHSDVLIVGAGIFGTSTAYHLSRSSNASVVVVDRTAFPPEHAASTDINKIVREDYSTRFYMDLATEAMEAWQSWPELAGKGFFHRTGWVAMREHGDDLASRIRKNFRDRGSDPTSTLGIDELRRKFGGLLQYTDLDGFEDAYLNPEAGWCDAGLATAELMKAATERGVSYVQGDVSQLVLGNDNRVAGVQLRNGERLTADKILLATGAWTSSLLPTVEDELGIEESGRMEQQVTAAGVCVAHYLMHPTELHLLKDMPVVIYGENGDAQPPPPRNNLSKLTNANSFTNTVTTSGGHKISVPPERDQRLVPEKLKAETIEIMSKRLFPQLTSRPVNYWRLCWDAVSPSQDHLICRHPDNRLANLYFAVGGSFHSYKFLPIIGKYVTNVLNGTSNGAEKDEHWAWKRTAFKGRGAHEKAYPHRELRDLEDRPKAQL